MAQTKKKRRRKHRGTQGGRIDRRPARGRARSRAEAQARARNRSKKGGPRVPEPPTWSSALKKGGIAAVLFVALLLLFGQSPAAAIGVGVLMLGFYVPMSFLLDRFMHQRYLRKEAQKRAEREAQRTGAGQVES
jgi:hypothetical protein